MLLGLRTVIYPAPDLETARSFFTELLGFGPYFDEPFYVGFEVEGYELGLDPIADPSAGAVTYWGVANAEHALTWLVQHGATELSAVAEVGGGIRVATVRVATGAVFGIIENPHFQAAQATSAGPGR